MQLFLVPKVSVRPVRMAGMAILSVGKLMPVGTGLCLCFCVCMIIPLLILLAHAHVSARVLKINIAAPILRS